MSGDRPPDRPSFGTLITTSFAMVAFAANSVLCRLAIGEGSADPAGFTAIRLGSGAAALFVLVRARGGPAPAPARGDPAPAPARPSWTAAAFLLVYAAGFSFAYVRLAAGTGALLLFGAVQATMIVAGLRAGERFGRAERVGLGAALVGLGVLVAPGVRAPSPGGAALMLAAGVAWGLYSLRGRGSRDPAGDTARHFAAAAPGAVLLAAALLPSVHVTARGALLAAVSGAVTSGLGYVIWYTALRGMTSVRAAIVQLSVPALAAVGGALFLREAVTARLLLSAALILGGVATAAVGHAGPRSGSPTAGGA